MKSKPFLVALWLLLPTAEAAEYWVDQKDKAFSAKKLSIKIGDSIIFKNSDSFFHNVFSLSDAKTFDLGSYPQGQSRTVIFMREGLVEVECAIHPQMRMTIEIKE